MQKLATATSRPCLISSIKLALMQRKNMERVVILLLIFQCLTTETSCQLCLGQCLCREEFKMVDCSNLNLNDKMMEKLDQTRWFTATKDYNALLLRGNRLNCPKLNVTLWRFIDFGKSKSLNCSCLWQYFLKYNVKVKCQNYTGPNTEITSTQNTGTTPMRTTIKPHQHRPTTQVQRHGHTTKFYRKALTNSITDKVLPEYVIVVIIITVCIFGLLLWKLIRKLKRYIMFKRMLASSEATLFELSNAQGSLEQLQESSL